MRTSIISILAALFFAAGAYAQNSLEEGFATPPQSAKAFTWWHWMNGNISKEGITADLEAMAKAGVGGVQAFNISIMSQGPVGYASDEWFDLTNHAIREAERLGIEFDIHNCPGWSSTGGFWITPELAGKQITWSQAYIKGGRQVDMVLPQPRKELDSYWDEVVIAYPSPKNDALVENFLVKATVDGKETSPADISMNSHKEIRFDKEVVLEFSQPVTARTLNGFIMNDMPPIPEAQRRQMQQGFASAPTGTAPTLSFSMDGKTWSEPKNISILMEAVSYLEFPETEFKYARIDAKQTVILEGLQFSGAPMNTSFLRNANYAMRAGGAGGFGGPFGMNQAPAAPKSIPAEYAIDPAEVINISEYMNEDGRLVWNAPEGDWTIIRMGYIPIDRHTKMGSTIGDGLEIDKYSREALKFHWDYLFPRLLPALESAADNVKAGMLIDSYEAGNLNWTPLMRQEFSKRRGYDMTGYLPALTGKYVVSEDTTERFMWDFRRTCADMFADNYLEYLADLCHEHGILLYNEPYNSSVFDEMQAGSRADIPMGEFWVRTHQDRSKVKMAGAIAHVNGKRVDGNQIVGAESYTGWQPDAAYQNFPYSLKAQGDDAWTVGLNRFIFHRFAHQPNVHANPGMSMGNIGFHFDRNNTWFEKGSQWLEYVARSQYMLQQGNIVADALYLVSENVPGSSSRAWNPDLPFGYFGDALNAEMLLNAVKVDGDALVNKDGVRYRLLIIQNEPAGKSMTIGVLRKIDEFVTAGGAVCGYAPVKTPNLSSAEEQAEFDRLVDKLWGGIPANGTKKVGKGRVFATVNTESVLEQLGIVPDVEYSFKEDAPVNFIHRIHEGRDIYFLANHRRTAESIVATFRVDGKRPELWNADTGEIIPVNVYDVLEDGRVRMTIQFDPVGSWFVVFSDKASADRYTSVALEGEEIIRTTPYAEREGGLYADVHDNFTISLWIRPESNSSIPGGRRGAMWGSSASSYPYVLGDAEALYGKGHSVAGIVATRAGVSLMERGAGQAQPVLVSQDKLASWNHIAVVYSDGVPSLYVNGELKETGKASGRTVHPTYKDIAISNNNLAFEGDFADYQVTDRAMTADEVKAEYAKGEPACIAPVEKVKYAADGGFLFFEDGRYTTVKNGVEETIKVKGTAAPKDLTANGWTVSFPAGLGAPEQITLDKLMPLQKHSDDGVKYFSGTATYKTTFDLKKSEIKGKTLFLDLGRVYVIASVKLNGKDLGVVWKAPYSLDITDTVTAGENVLEVEVANLWTNRLIGDAQTPDAYNYGQGDAGALPEWYLNNQPKPEDGKVAFSVVKLFEADEPLYDSGLVGPVVIRTAIKKQ